MQVVNETTLLKTNNRTHKNAKFTKVADQFLSSSKVHSPTHLTRLWFSAPTDCFTNLLIRLRVRRQLIKKWIPSLYMSHTAHMFTSKNKFWRGVQDMRNGYKINLETKICERKWNSWICALDSFIIIIIIFSLIF